MLLSNVKIDDVVSMKLKSGDEIIATVVSDETKFYVIKNPLTVVMSPTGGLAMFPFLMGMAEDDTISIQKSDILAQTVSRKELKNAYLEETSKTDAQTTGFDENSAKPAPSFGGGRGGRGGRGGLVQT